MTVQMTIIGLGQIGASIGLALANQQEQVSRVGHDIDYGIARNAQKMGAIDRAEANLHNAVDNADIVVLAIPMDQIRPTLEHIAEDLKEGAVLLDTSPLKSVVAGWAAELIAEGRYFIGMTPAINPTYLLAAESGLAAARPDLFKDGLIAIVAPPRANSDAIKLAADLARLLGATPMFFDPLEIDSLMTGTHLLPQLLSAAMANATLDRPGWVEARKIAGRPYAQATNVVRQNDSPQAMASAITHNRENMLRVLDGLIAELAELRTAVDVQDGDAIEDKFVHARLGVELWWTQRKDANWAGAELELREPMPSSATMLARLVGVRRKPKK